jgi:hypothetical protein
MIREQRMINFWRQLWRDRCGSALLIAGAALPLVVGAAGLASDTIQWALWKRQIQRAADSAAIAGAYARVAGASHNSAVTTDLAKNSHTWMAWASGYPSVNAPADTTTRTYQVSVGLGVRQTLSFSSLFLSSAPLITANATAAAMDDGNFCVVALDNTAGSGITIGGSATANLGCGVISNSTSSDSSIGVNGNAYGLTASPVAAVGGLPSASLASHGASNIQPYHLAQPDPYLNKYDTNIPGGMPCKNNIAQGEVGGIVQPGCYNNFNPGNGTTTLAAGTYYLNNTGLSINGNTTITGNGVTLIFTGTNPGSLTMNGNAIINLTAPTSGAFANMLMIQSPNASSANVNKVNGNNGAKLDGAIYFPKGKMTFTGSASAATKCLMVVAWNVDFGGNSDIQNNTTGCVANTTVAGKKIRLVV